MEIKGKKSIFGKFAVLVLVAVLVSALVLLAGCGKGTPSGSDDDDLEPEVTDAGFYAIYSLTTNGETYDEETLREAGFDYYIQLNENGTMEINFDGLYLGTWEDGVLNYTMEGEEYSDEYVLENGYLTIEIIEEDDEVIMVFKLTVKDEGTSEEGDSAGDRSDVEAFFTLGELKEIQALLSEAYNAWELREMDYAEVRDTFFNGAEGTIDVDNEYITTYQWYATDDEQAFVEVSFHTDEPGSEDRKPDGIRSYLP